MKRYPIIDYTKCVNCGACYMKCAHDVFDIGEKGKPLITRTENCSSDCDNCVRLCYNDAIKYSTD